MAVPSAAGEIFAYRRRDCGKPARSHSRQASARTSPARAFELDALGSSAGLAGAGSPSPAGAAVIPPIGPPVVRGFVAKRPASKS